MQYSYYYSLVCKLSLLGVYDTYTVYSVCTGVFCNRVCRVHREAATAAVTRCNAEPATALVLPFLVGSLGVAAVLILAVLLALLLVLLCRKTSDTYEGTVAYCIPHNEFRILCVSLSFSCLLYFIVDAEEEVVGRNREKELQQEQPLEYIRECANLFSG